MKLAQVQHRRVEVGAGRELLVVDRQDERAGAALLLRELRQVAIAGDAQHLEALALDGLRQRADAQARGVLGAEVFVDDDDGKAKFHAAGLRAAGQNGQKGAKCTEITMTPDAALRRLTRKSAIDTKERQWPNRRSGGCSPAARSCCELLPGTFYLLLLAHRLRGRRARGARWASGSTCRCWWRRWSAAARWLAGT